MDFVVSVDCMRVRCGAVRPTLREKKKNTGNRVDSDGTDFFLKKVGCRHRRVSYDQIKRRKQYHRFEKNRGMYQ